MKALYFLALFFTLNAHAQFDGRGHPGVVYRAYVKDGAAWGATLVPGEDRTRQSDAVYPVADVTEVTRTTLKIVGKGVKVKTGEAVAFACIGAQSNSAELGPSCDYLRALYYNPKTQKTFAFGQIYYVNDQNFKGFFESLKESWQQVGCPRVTVNRFLAFYSEDLTNKDGWSWSSSPKRIPYRRFLSMMTDIQGADLSYYTKVKGMIFAEMIQPEHPSQFSPWYSPSGGGYGPNGGFYSVYK